MRPNIPPRCTSSQCRIRTLARPPDCKPVVHTSTMHPLFDTSSLKIRLAVLALIAELAHLGWEHLHGGILTHHFLRSGALPGLHNAWGLLLLPALAWWAGWRIEKRLAGGSPPGEVIVRGLMALLAGLALSAAFSAGLEGLSAAVFLGMLVLSLLLPVCRAECWLGLVLGMSFTFGAVIPTLLGAVLTGLSALLHLRLKPALARRWAAFRRA